CLGSMVSMTDNLPGAAPLMSGVRQNGSGPGFLPGLSVGGGSGPVEVVTLRVTCDWIMAAGAPGRPHLMGVIWPGGGRPRANCPDASRPGSAGPGTARHGTARHG